jgi:GTP-binding protein LepA
MRSEIEPPEKQKRMRQFGKVDIPQEAFIAALKVDV